MAGRRQEHFDAGRGIEAPQRTCEACGFTSPNPKHFKRTETGQTCATGHYEDREGNQKRARNPYAARR